MAMRTTDRSPRIERAFDRYTREVGQPVIDTVPFTASGVFDKLGLLVLLALLTGAVGYATASSGLFLLGLIVGLVASLVGIFKPTAARIAAPIYALAEGLALGALTAIYATG